ncbi:MAG: nitroreductase/quinone reductase family protein [Candidatus Korobacteraceae bacterium]
MPTSDDSLKGRLARYRQITIGVIGRKSGRKISIPVWFVLEDSNTLYLLPVQGSDTQWYKNILHNQRMRIAADGKGRVFRAMSITDPKAVQHVVEAFRTKYSARNVKKYYSKFDVAVRIDVS